MKILEDKGYSYKKHLSTGGEGEVHLVKLEEKDYIAKIFPMLSNESIDVLKTIQKLNIAGIPKIHDIFNHQDKTIIIRDYVEGTTLYDEIRKNESLSLRRSKTIIINICQTLKQFHNAKPNPIIYRDLKPENIIVTPQGSIQLIDFGIARYYKREQTRDTVLAGTRGYTAPEVMAGMQSDQRSDIYSAGLLLYEMLTGKNLLVPPFQIRPVGESNEYLPEWLDTVISKATNINQTARYKTIDDFIHAIENPVIQKKKKQQPKFIIIALITLAIAVVVIASVFAVKKWDIFHLSNFISPEKTEDNNTKDLIESKDENYTVLIDIEFDDEEDNAWVMGSDQVENVEFKDGKMYVAMGCNIDYITKPGMFVHYKATFAEYSAVAIGAYRINGPINFEAVYTNEDESMDYSSNMIYFEGIPFKNTGQVVDAIIYVTEDNSAMYAIAIDEEAKKICYVSYQVPDSLKEIPLYMAINNFTDGRQNTVIESVIVAKGSLRKYLEDNFKTYAEYKELIDDFLEEDIGSLDEMIIKPVYEWE